MSNNRGENENSGLSDENKGETPVLPPEEVDKVLASEDISTAEPPARNFRSELFDWAEAMVSALIFIVITFALIVRVTVVIGPSMIPTLYDDERLLISHLFFSPKQGDVVIITKDSFMDEPIVKRIIATEGQTIDIDFITHTVTVDGVVLDEPYINEPTALSEGMTFPAVVPDGCVFVMGDNRNESTDSRDTRLGFVDKRFILGRVILRIYPFDRIKVFD